MFVRMSITSIPDFCAQVITAHRSSEQQKPRNTSPQEMSAFLYRKDKKTSTFHAADGQMLRFLFPIILSDVQNPFKIFPLRFLKSFNPE